MHLSVSTKFNSPAVYPDLRNPRYNSLDFWRGVACLAIVILHSAYFAKPNLSDLQFHQHPIAGEIYNVINNYFHLGVPIFFVISGYCIAATADSSRRKAHPTTHYFKRRFRRIYPPYWVALLLALGVVGILAIAGKPQMLSQTTLGHVPSVPGINQIQAPQWLGNLTLTEHWRPRIGGPGEQEIISPAWTLCYEEQFYAVCGILLLVSRRRFFAGTIAVTIATLISFGIAVTHPQLNFSGLFFDGLWLMFAAGVFVYYHLNYTHPAWREMAVPAGLLVAIVLFKVLPRFMPAATIDYSTDILYETHVSCAFALLILLLRPLDASITQSRILSPISFCGRMCYSLYLMHWITCVVIGHVLLHLGVQNLAAVLLITVPTVVAASITVAWIFHVLIERRFLNTPSAATRTA